MGKRSSSITSGKTHYTYSDFCHDIPVGDTSDSPMEGAESSPNDVQVADSSVVDKRPPGGCILFRQRAREPLPLSGVLPCRH